MSEILSAKGLTKIYGKGNKVTALNDVDISVDEGDFISLRGPSGSGKSTLLNILGCLDNPSSGKITVENTEVSAMTEGDLAKIRREKIGFVFQSFNLIPILNAVENVELPMENIPMSKVQRREKAMKLLKTVGLEDRADHRPSEMSGGEKQRVAIARSLANSPAIILADEPTGNLDSATGKKIIKLMADLNRNLGTTILFVTHDQIIAKYATRQLFMDDGRITDRTKSINARREITDTLKISQKLANKLVSAGYTTVDRICGLGESDLMKIRKMKRNEAKNILNAVEKHKMKIGKKDRKKK